MVKAEMIILRNLGFNVQVQLPYGLMINYLQSLDLINNPQVPQLAWNYLNDALLTRVYTIFQPHVVACSAIYLAAKKHEVELPSEPSWFEIFDTSETELLIGCKMILSVYESEIPKIAPIDRKELDLYVDGKLESHILQLREDLLKKEAKESMKSRIPTFNEFPNRPGFEKAAISERERIIEKINSNRPNNTQSSRSNFENSETLSSKHESASSKVNHLGGKRQGSRRISGEGVGVHTVGHHDVKKIHGHGHGLVRTPDHLE
ncbi:Cyclin-L1 [Smittium mucronatum]|uniref:Cyclin-L1 n=1 Tax=Smittium mucronatum TaxID=133383 RepID=A0A1R0GW75_9FUNG|nr:Cyclin-L1 [Smittium mucronatum]